MTLLVAVNAFRRGTGATHVAANLAALLAQAGQRVGLIDGDFLAPSQHFLLNVMPDQMHGSLHEYLLGYADLQAVTIDVSINGAVGVMPQPKGAESGAPQGAPGSRPLYFVPSTADATFSARRPLTDGDLDRLGGGIQAWADRLALDILIVDTPAGIGKETLFATAVCDYLLVVLTLDQREVQGSSLMIDLARKLMVPQVGVVVNKAPVGYSRQSVRRQIAEGYGCEVAAILPYADEIAALESRSLFACRYPDHPATWTLRQLADALRTTTQQARAQQVEPQ